MKDQCANNVELHILLVFFHVVRSIQENHVINRKVIRMEKNCYGFKTTGELGMNKGVLPITLINVALT